MKTRCFGALGVVLVAIGMVGCSERGAGNATPHAAPAAPVVAMPAASGAPSASAAPVATPASSTPQVTNVRPTLIASDGTLTVKRLVLAQGVKDREPVDPGTSFKGGAHKVYAFVEVENRGRAPREIVLEFEPPGGGAPHGEVTLAVGPAPRWRTWAYTRTASTTGSWTAVVKNEKGDVLARAPFDITL